MKTNDILVYAAGIRAISTPVILVGLGYGLASLIARFTSTTSRQIYLRRLVYFLMMFVFLQVWNLSFRAEALQGNLLDTNHYLFSMARHLGLDYGWRGSWIWVVIAVIDKPGVRLKRDPQGESS